MKSVYVIPTNRSVAFCLPGYITEVDIGQQMYSMRIPLLVLDSGDKLIEEENREICCSLRRRHPTVSLHHIPWKEQRTLIKELTKSAGVSADWEKLLLPSYCDYGAMMNRIVLLAAAAGCDVIHRRDSDTCIQNERALPLVRELELLQATHHKSTAIFGSGYVDEWNLDIRSFAENDPVSFSDFLACLSIPYDAHAQYIERTIQGSRDYFAVDGEETTFNEETLPEAGNFAVRSLQDAFPSPLAKQTLGTDYFLFKMAEVLGLGAAFHNRRVRHQYHNARRNRDYTFEYLRAIAKLCDHSPVYWYLKQHLLQTRRSHGVSVQKLRSEASRFLSSDLEESRYHREAAWDKFLGSIVSKHFPSFTDTLRRERSTILDECGSDYLIHSRLITVWPDLISAAKNSSKKLIEERYDL